MFGAVEPAHKRDRLIGLWILACAMMVWAMVVLGGVTRLTRSGLSIVEWQPVAGALPPLTEGAWQREFAAYQQSPEGRIVNRQLDMTGFRRIYYVEWLHRLLGRITGLFVLVPGIVFASKRQLPKRVSMRLLAIFSFGALQAGVGWAMVKSGLSDLPQVDPLWLMAHLLLAVAIFTALLWLALDQLFGQASPSQPPVRAAFTLALLVSIVVTVAFGALLAGHHAGPLYPTFPTMNGSFWPEALAAQRVAPSILLGTPAGVHFMHRLLALVTSLTASAAVLAGWSRGGRRERMAAAAVLSALLMQVALGALTVLTRVELTLASAHQANALVLLAGALFQLHTQCQLARLHAGARSAS